MSRKLASQFPRRSRQGGLTLVETMITLAVAAILLTAAVPPMQDFIVRNRMSTEVNTFIASMYLARSEAVKRMQNVIACPTTDYSSCSGNGTAWQAGWMVFADVDNSGGYSSSDVIIQRNPTLPSRFRISSTTLPLLGYTSRGQLLSSIDCRTTPSGECDVGFCDSGSVANTRTVHLTNEGRVRVEQDPSAGGCS